MKKLTLLAILTVLTVGCVEESECYKCELISVDGRFSRTEYVSCDTDIEHYKEWLYDRGKVSVVKCTEL